ncbi:MAG TPA: cytosine permease, partial [Verrucomicrobiota bacterium]|nr:cytosine permease [Verrucomicrobiota bacterium]
IGVAVTSATIVVYNIPIWDPVQLMARFNHPVLTLLALATLAIATISTNIAANVVSPANDFSNLCPRRISFKTGGIITGVIGILMFPWKLYADPKGYIFTWLIGYSALLGPIAGIMIADYFIYRKRRINVAELYRADGEYSYTRGFSIVGLVSLFLSVLPNLPGFLATVGAVNKAGVPAVFLSIYNYAWFVGFAVAFGVYLIVRKWTSSRG